MMTARSALPLLPFSALSAIFFRPPSMPPRPRFFGSSGGGGAAAVWFAVPGGTDSTVASVRIAVPDSLPPSARILSRAGFICGYIAMAIAMSCADAPATIGPYSFCA